MEKKIHPKICQHFAEAVNWKCDCGEYCNPMSDGWRWNGLDWEHCHQYPMGHVVAEDMRKETKK